MLSLTNSISDITDGLSSKQNITSEAQPLSATLVNGLIPSLNRIDSAFAVRYPLINAETPLSTSLVDGLENSLNTVSTFNNQIGTKANITNVYYKSELYTKLETHDLLNSEMNSNVISEYYTQTQAHVFLI